MKYVLSLMALIISHFLYCQTTGYFRYDSVRFEKVGGNSEFILLNSTRNVTGGVLTNLGNGRTGFVTPSGGGSGGLSGGNLGSGFRVYYPPSEGVKTLFNGYAVLIDSSSNSNGLTLKADTFNVSTRAWRQKGIDSVAALIPAQVNLIAGTNVTITGTYPNKTINAAGDANWVFLSDYGTPSDGLSDTAAIKAAVATGKNVYVTPGEWIWDGYRCTLNSNQIIRGYGPTSIIRSTKDTCDIFYIPTGTHHVQIDFITFVGKGRGATPGGEVFTLSNAIFIQGDSNRVQYCNFRSVKGSGVTGWRTGSTMYANEVTFCRFDSCGVGIYALTNMEYSLFGTNQAYFCRVGFSEYCAGNNTWDFLTSIYNDYGMRILGSSGCNGDHGSVTNFRFNHNTTYGLELRQTNNEYYIGNGKFYNNNVALGTTDTVYRAIFSGCVFSNLTITTTKAVDCVIEGGTFGTGAVTVTGTTGIEFCHIMNSPYETTVCGGGSALTNPMTTAEDIIVGGTGGTPQRLAKGANGTFLGVSGGAVQYLSLPGGGDVSKVGTPVDNQVAVWTGDGTAEGTSGLTYNGSAFNATGTGTFSSTLTAPTLNGSASANGTIIIQGNNAGSGNTGTNDNILFKTGNTPTTRMSINNNGEFGFNISPFSGFAFTFYGLGNTGSTTHTLWRNSSANNIFIMDNAGSWKLGNQSATTSTGMMLNKNGVGTGTAFSPTAWLHIGAGTASANTAPLKFTAGTNLTTTEAGAVEYDGSHLYFTASNGGTRFQLDQQGGMTNPMTTTGDIIYSSSGSTPARLGIGSAGQYLSVVSGVPAWVSLSTTLSYGTYSPTATEVTNGGGVGGTTVTTCQFMKVGTTVTVSGKITIDPSATSTFTEVRLTIPVASNFSAVEQAGGTGVSTDGTLSNWGIVADATNDAVIFQGYPISSVGNVISFSFTYQVL